jgi:hypothetical protein
MQSLQMFERFCGSENSIIYVMVTAPPLFSAPRVRVGLRVRDRVCGSGPGGNACGPCIARSPPTKISLHAAAGIQKIRILRTAFSLFYTLPPAIQTLTIVCISFGSLNRYFANFAPDPP